MELPDLETVAAAVHQSWMESKLELGITTRRSETSEELMVPYALLSEPAKDLDRNTGKAVYVAIEEVAR